MQNLLRPFSSNLFSCCSALSSVITACRCGWQTWRKIWRTFNRQTAPPNLSICPTASAKSPQFSTSHGSHTTKEHILSHQGRELLLFESYIFHWLPLKISAAVRAPLIITDWLSWLLSCKLRNWDIASRQWHSKAVCEVSVCQMSVGKACVCVCAFGGGHALSSLTSWSEERSVSAL